jgi:hypothetical protein
MDLAFVPVDDELDRVDRLVVHEGMSSFSLSARRPALVIHAVAVGDRP